MHTISFFKKKKKGYSETVVKLEFCLKFCMFLIKSLHGMNIMKEMERGPLT